jgi:hypothetical protein
VLSGRLLLLLLQQSLSSQEEMTLLFLWRLIYCSHSYSQTKQPLFVTEDLLSIVPCSWTISWHSATTCCAPEDGVPSSPRLCEACSTAVRWTQLVVCCDFFSFFSLLALTTHSCSVLFGH